MTVECLQQKHVGEDLSAFAIHWIHDDHARCKCGNTKCVLVVSSTGQTAVAAAP